MKMPKIQTYYHYTIMDRLEKILKSGYLKLTPNKIDLYKNEKQFVWLTKNSEWDKTVFINNPIEVLNEAGRVRITIHGDYPSHTKYKTRLVSLERLEASARRVGVNPRDWAVSTKKIPVKSFNAVEVWKDGKWVDYYFESKD